MAKILVIDDERAIRNTLKEILEFEGYTVEVAENGRIGLDMALAAKYDLIYSDIKMPEMDGMEVLKSVRKWSNLPVVVVSARSYEHDKVEALDCGADDFITKPFGTSELLARIRAAIRHTRTTLSDPRIALSGKFTAGDLTIDYEISDLRELYDIV